MKVAVSHNVSAIRIGWEMRFVAAFLFTFAGCSVSTNDEREAKSTAGDFYDVYIKLRPSGVPSKEQQLQFKKVISTGLAGLLYEASVAEEGYSKQTESEARPRIEGDLFTSLDQGAVSYKVLQCKSQRTSVTCDVELTSIDERDHSKLTWKDRMFFVREENRWVVDDIEYLGERQFMHKGRLKDILSKVIQEAQKETG
jgi:hypothetical protein